MVEGFRLSPPQRFLWQRVPGRSPVQGVIGLRGDLEYPGVEGAVQRVVERHEALRTRLQGRPGMRLPLQVVAGSTNQPCDRLDVRRLTERQRQARLAELLTTEARRLGETGGEGQACRFVLVERSASEGLLLVTLDPLLADARTLANLLAELAAAYADPPAYAQGGEEAVQYLQFSEWRNEIASEDEAGAGSRHWREVDERWRPARLPIAGPAHQGEAAPRGRAFADLRSETRSLLARRCGDTGFESWLLAAWMGLIRRLTGEPEAAVVCSLDGRKFEDLAGVLGLLASPVPLQVTIEEGFRFSEVVERAAESVREASRWQEHFQPDQSGILADSPALGFTFDRWPESIDSAGVHWWLDERRLSAWPWELDLSCVLHHDRLAVELGYDAALYRPEDAAAVLSQWETLLASGLAQPTRSLRELELRSEAERHQVLVALNDTSAQPLAAATVHELFTRAARATPAAPAVVYEDRLVTYAELDAMSNRLAHRLLRLGVEPEDRVGLYLDRSVEIVAAMLAALKAGCAYLPLDPGLPVLRTATLLAEAGARVLVTNGADASALAPHRCAVVDLAAAARELAAEPSSEPRVCCRPENLAYVLFTSGSTGRPKGVAVEHRQLLNYLGGILDRLQLPTDASYATVSSFAADLGNTAVFPALCRGGCLQVISQERLADPLLLAEAFRRHPVDCLKIVPSHLSALLDSPAPQAVLPRRLLVLGGEAASRELVARVERLAPGLRVLNHYGPTETTVGVMTGSAQAGLAEARCATLPLGAPIANTRVYLVDSQLSPVPMGVAGELLVGGHGLSRGYLGRPDLTAERFVPDPFADRPGCRLYRTGDLVRYLPGGAIRFEGRIDHQVKIRGFRVELGEIEAALRLDAAVRDAVAVVREEEPGRPRLTAYLVPQRNAEVDVRRLRQLLRERLPEAMIPGALVVLDRLPLNANGKVDRTALPAPEAVATAAPQRGVAPRTLDEELLAGVWRETLGLDAVGIYDNFFELGGHSLLATQLISRARKVLGVDISLATFFDQPTVAALAERIEQGRRAASGAQAPSVEPVERNGSLPLSFAQERLWLMSQLEPESEAYNVPRCVRLRGPLDLGAIGRTLATIGHRHEVLRTTFAAAEGAPRLVVAPTVDLAPRVVELAALPPAQREAEAARLATAEARRPFDLGRGPLLRVVLVRFSAEEHLALLTSHHIVSDAWSMGVFIAELAELYDAFTSGRPPKLAELPIQYADYAVWQRHWLAGEVLAGELSFWRSALAGSREEVLPPDFERPARPSFAGRTLAHTLDGDLARSLAELGQREGATLFMTLLAGFVALLSRQTGAEDVVVGTDVANRGRLELERLIGFFVNNLVLRTDLAGDPSFLDLLKRVRSSTLAALSHQDLPFDQLVKALRPRRAPGRTPLFQVLFVLQNAPRRELELADVTLEPVDLEVSTAKFDVALFIAHQGGRLTTTWSYRSEIFARATIELLAERFETLLRSACRAPEQRLRELEIDSEAGRLERSAELKTREEARLLRLQAIRRQGVAEGSGQRAARPRGSR